MYLHIKSIRIQQELSSPVHFRIQGGSPERDTGVVGVVVVVGVVRVVAGLHFPFPLVDKHSHTFKLIPVRV